MLLTIKHIVGQGPPNYNSGRPVIWALTNGIWSYEYLSETVGVAAAVSVRGNYKVVGGQDTNNAVGVIWVNDGSSWIRSAVPLPVGATKAWPCRVLARAADDVVLLVYVLNGASHGAWIVLWDGNTFTYVIQVNDEADTAPGITNSGLDWDGTYIMAVPYGSFHWKYAYYTGSGDISNPASWTVGFRPAWSASSGGMCLVSPSEAYLGLNLLTGNQLIGKWNGSSWSQWGPTIPANPFTVVYVDDVVYVDADHVWVAVHRNNNGESLIGYTNGSSWTFPYSDTGWSRYGWRAFDRAGDSFVAVGEDGDGGWVAISDDGGQTWDKYSSGAGTAPSPGTSGYYDCDWAETQEFVVAEDGGYEIVLEGSFPVATPLEVLIGDELCYGGQGYGYQPQSADGATLTVVTPPLVAGEHDVGWRTVGGSPTAVGTVVVVDRNLSGKQYGMRAGFAPWVSVGPRRTEGA